MLELTPAYGRDYKTAKAAKADWLADKDFIIASMFHPFSGKPINRAQGNGEAFLLRYAHNTKIVRVTS